MGANDQYKLIREEAIKWLKRAEFGEYILNKYSWMAFFNIIQEELEQ